MKKMLKKLLVNKINQFRKFYDGLSFNTFIEIAWTVGPTLILMLPVVTVFAILYSIEEVYVEPSNDNPVSLNTVPEVELTPVKSAEVELTPVKSAGLLEAGDTLDEDKEKLRKADAIFKNRLLMGCLGLVVLGIVGWQLYPYLVDYWNGSSSAPSPSSSSGSDSPVSFLGAPGCEYNAAVTAYDYMYEHASIEDKSSLALIFEHHQNDGCTFLEATIKTLKFGRDMGIGLAEGK